MTLEAHLTTWLGKWPGDGQGLTVVGSSRRTEPGWDGQVHAVIGVSAADGRGVLSVPPAVVDAVSAALAQRNPEGVPAAAGVGGRLFTGVFRWSTAPAALPDAGEWVTADDPSVPEWLRPFGGEVLVALDPDTGEHLSGVGIKRHDAYGQELAVVTRRPQKAVASVGGWWPKPRAGCSTKARCPPTCTQPTTTPPRIWPPQRDSPTSDGRSTARAAR